MKKLHVALPSYIYTAYRGENPDMISVDMEYFKTERVADKGYYKIYSQFHFDTLVLDEYGYTFLEYVSRWLRKVRDYGFLVPLSVRSYCLLDNVSENFLEKKTLLDIKPVAIRTEGRFYFIIWDCERIQVEAAIKT